MGLKLQASKAFRRMDSNGLRLPDVALHSNSLEPSTWRGVHDQDIVCNSVESSWEMWSSLKLWSCQSIYLASHRALSTIVMIEFAASDGGSPNAPESNNAYSVAARGGQFVDPDATEPASCD
ncbi:uncharacterized protein A4U43_C01F2850 [Asparagus officinalis]|uniref:Uncharacterized protein n=1 Tax=Asparagus officinalis TaxID=4686 RepID=A0A5P1FQV3_ASPOF|nr:uncharacterized protein A4U43_C01F2850 [Asparagus officinalis]